MCKTLVPVVVFCLLFLLAATAYSQETVTLTVNSAHGSPTPSVGDHSYLKGTPVTATVATPVGGGGGLIRYACVGWKAKGSQPSNPQGYDPPEILAVGFTNSVYFTIDSNVVLTWKWKTQYLLTLNVEPAGAGHIDFYCDSHPEEPAGTYPPTEGGYWTVLRVAQLTAVANEGYDFAYWSGGSQVLRLEPTKNPTVQKMRRPETITAVFVPKPPTYSTEASGVIGTLGGVVEVTDPQSPIFGAKIEIPPDTLQLDATIDIKIVTSNPPPFVEPENFDVTVGSEVIYFSSTEPILQPVRISIPYPDADNDGVVDGTSTSTVGLNLLYYDEESYIWCGIPTGTVSVDPSTRTVSSMTEHLSHWRWFSAYMREGTETSPKVYKWTISRYTSLRFPTEVTDEEIREQVERAIEIWDAELPLIDFVYSAAQPVDIEVSWDRGWLWWWLLGDPFGYVISGPGLYGQDIYLNDTGRYGWEIGDTPGTDSRYDVCSATLHEFCHVLGITGDTYTGMPPIIDGLLGTDDVFDVLDQEDIASLAEGYRVYKLTTSVSPEGSGTITCVTSDPEDTPRHPWYRARTVVTLTAVPSSGYAFYEWTGDVAGTENPTTITMNSDKGVTANFLRPSEAAAAEFCRIAAATAEAYRLEAGIYPVMDAARAGDPAGGGTLFENNIPPCTILTPSEAYTYTFIFTRNACAPRFEWILTATSTEVGLRSFFLEQTGGKWYEIGQIAAAQFCSTAVATAKAYRAQAGVYPYCDTANEDILGGGNTLFENTAGCAILTPFEAYTYTFVFRDSNKTFMRGNSNI